VSERPPGNGCGGADGIAVPRSPQSFVDLTQRPVSIEHRYFPSGARSYLLCWRYPSPNRCTAGLGRA
jgi:hypothetical protein